MNAKVSTGIFKAIVFSSTVVLAAAGTYRLRAAVQSSAAAQVPAAAQPTSPINIPISSSVPPDVTGTAPNATLQDAAIFAWQEFIALNWPAKAGVRDTPDTTRFFGDGKPGPLVWHTYRAKVEIFPGNGNASVGPHGFNSGGPDFGYDEPPQYIYGSAVLPCSGQSTSNTAWINLDEVTQIALDKMYAGIVPAGATPTNSNPQLIRFMAKANRTQYKYIVSQSFWYSQGSQKARANLIAAIRNKQFPPASPYPDFPAGTIEVKSAFRPLAASDDPSRFYTTTVRYYEPGPSNAPCYREDVWALLALHIDHKTPTSPAFTWATFEQADNLQTSVGGRNVAVEDENGLVVHDPGGPSTNPTLSYKDAPFVRQPPSGPRVTVNGPYCAKIGPNLFYRDSDKQANLPSGGNICVNRRDFAIPPAVVKVNTAAHAAISQYAQANGIAPATVPWMYYKLVNIQTFPFNKTDIVSDPDSPHNSSTFHQANIVVETDYTLQNFSGSVPNSIPNGGAPSDYDNKGKLYFQNVQVLKNGQFVSSFNMGGCMGCHGIAQTVLGSDFSFLLAQGSVSSPEAPSDALASAKLFNRYMRVPTGVPPTSQETSKPKSK